MTSTNTTLLRHQCTAALLGNAIVLDRTGLLTLWFHDNILQVLVRVVRPRAIAIPARRGGCAGCCRCLEKILPAT